MFKPCKECETPLACTGRQRCALGNTLVGYLTMVSDFWSEGNDETCHLCDLQDEHGHCGMLHDRTVPDGDCLGLLIRLGLKQPAEVT